MIGIDQYKGIGPSDELVRNGIPVVVANENVGQKLVPVFFSLTLALFSCFVSMQDHPLYSVITRVQADIVASSLFNDIASMQAAQMQYAANGTGPLTSNSGVTYGFESINASELLSLGDNYLVKNNRTNQSHIEYEVVPNFFPNLPYPNGASNLRNESYLTIMSVLIAPSSRGNVTLYSNDPYDAPVINVGVS